MYTYTVFFLYAKLYSVYFFYKIKSNLIDSNKYCILYNNKNEITAIGDNCSVHLSYDGKSVLSKVEYTPSQLMGFRTGENGLALLFNQIGQLSEKEAVFYDSALNEKARSVITGPIRSIEYNGDELVIL